MNDELFAQYQYIRDKIESLVEQGVSLEEILTMLEEDLG